LFYSEQYYDNETVLPLTVSSEVKQPIIVRYELTAFYQNHQRFIDSKDLIQNSIFNDSFRIFSSNNIEVPIDVSNIAFNSDRVVLLFIKKNISFFRNLRFLKVLLTSELFGPKFPHFLHFSNCME
jgi:hypothetical protein